MYVLLQPECKIRNLNGTPYFQFDWPCVQSECSMLDFWLAVLEKWSEIGQWPAVILHSGYSSIVVLWIAVPQFIGALFQLYSPMFIRSFHLLPPQLCSCSARHCGIPPIHNASARSSSWHTGGDWVLWGTEALPRFSPLLLHGPLFQQHGPIPQWHSLHPTENHRGPLPRSQEGWECMKTSVQLIQTESHIWCRCDKEDITFILWVGVVWHIPHLIA